MGKHVRVKNLRKATKRIETFTDDATIAARSRMEVLFKDEPDGELRGLIVLFNALQSHEDTGIAFHDALTYVLDKYEAAKPGETII